MFTRLLRFARALGHDGAVLWYACRNPTTPLSIKIGALLLALYVISPVDLLPDWIPLAGWVDDLGVATFGIAALLRWLPPSVAQEARGLAARRRSGGLFRRGK